MTNLVVDALIAILKITDRGLCVVEQNVRRRPTPRADVDAPPAGVGDLPASAANPGGHSILSTSELLNEAADWITVAYRDSHFAPALLAELTDRAARLAAEGD